MILDSNILIGALAVLVLVLVADVFCLRRKVRKLLRGGKGENIGDVLKSLDLEVKDVQKFKSEMEKYLVNLEKRVRRSTQAAETVRFNAFRDAGIGGYQSFATALLNEEGDGTVLSSLYSRDRVSVFSKPVKKYSSEIELSEEERKVISLAKEKLAQRS